VSTEARPVVHDALTRLSALSTGTSATAYWTAPGKMFGKCLAVCHVYYTSLTGYREPPIVFSLGLYTRQTPVTLLTAIDVGR